MAVHFDFTSVSLARLKTRWQSESSTSGNVSFTRVRSSVAAAQSGRQVLAMRVAVA
ncbi:hypothetical protein [Actinoplanes teichomyceticus]|uniref:Uncharacterized protein n=1 Tax=Actinoplanes teichomyceticus TaxID=1867 RepID=A0A561VR04_ACTTI|nr:hypothetical protein [Actinoplanes teichomyceticus]TWG14030.1 hypothetical protein FHX34_104324 [Actinoplanes teichomyceticus]